MSQFNSLPDSYEGSQRRRANFASAQDKLEFDAGNLIKLAEAISREKGIAVSPESLITREDDDLDALRRQIGILLKAKPEKAASTVETILEAQTNALTEKKLSVEQQSSLLKTLKARFEANMKRHPDLRWNEVQASLEASPEKLWALSEMERTGGEPDVIGFDPETSEYIFRDRSPESPTGRRNCVYDQKAEDWLRTNHPDETCNGNAVSLALAMGIEILTAEQYRRDQELEPSDTHSRSWVITHEAIRSGGGALIGDRDGGLVVAGQGDASGHYGDWAFRGELRGKKA